jgi:hypothetical protein
VQVPFIAVRFRVRGDADERAYFEFDDILGEMVRLLEESRQWLDVDILCILEEETIPFSFNDGRVLREG